MELARALYLARHFEAAQAVFRLILETYPLPWPVRQNIFRYLDEIDLELGFYHFNIALVSDSNPANFTSSNQVTIGGQTFTVEAPADNQTIYGMEYDLYGARALFGKQVIGRFNLLYTDFERSRFDRSLLNLALEFKPPSLPRFRFTPSITRYWRDDAKRYDLFEVSAKYFPDPVFEFRQSHELTAGRLRIADAPHLDANRVSLHSQLQQPLSRSLLLEYGLILEKHATTERPYAYRQLALELGVSFNWSQLRVNIDGLLGRKSYRQTDPLFGSRRKDDDQSLSLTLRHPRLKLLGRTLEAGIAYQRTDSTLSFYSYDKTSLFLRLTQRR